MEWSDSLFRAAVVVFMLAQVSLNRLTRKKLKELDCEGCYAHNCGACRGNQLRGVESASRTVVLDVARPANVDVPGEPSHAANDTSRVRRDGEVA